MRRAAIGVAVVGVLIGGATAAALAVRRSVDADERACAARLADAELKIRTDRWDPPEELADLGEYLGIHWQLRAGGAACSWVPGPTGWQYQMVVQLRPAQAHALAQRISETAKQAAAEQAGEEHPAAGESTGQAGDGMAVPGDVWPGLAGFLPSAATWVHHAAYDDLHHSARWRALYVDPVSSRAFVALNDH